ncbi:alkyl hydroperoxide reductase [Lentzea guizhouensis]|uniref:Alkyl hydroperoxide reductase n=1 Tax=Lentzea guizhouensis TaxID=1586287 RepID=A0A1B2HID5_9PSEU|nr:TlpA disulfide reductase family protein [Lentzea guizhouensis]ANZ37479.1 alkyl hydroperoxide reductase [Lentzea guizhouensis]
MKRLLVLLLLLSGCTVGKDASQVGGGDFYLVAPGGQVKIRYAPAERKELKGLEGESLLEPGKTVRLSDYAGKPVVINIWGAWCGPCRTEAPEMQKLFDAGTQVIGVDVKETSPEHPRDFMNSRKLTYPSIYDPSGRSFINVFKGLSPNVVPSTFVIDKNHKVAAVFLQPVLEQDLKPVVEELGKE